MSARANGRRVGRRRPAAAAGQRARDPHRRRAGAAGDRGRIALRDVAHPPDGLALLARLRARARRRAPRAPQPARRAGGARRRSRPRLGRRPLAALPSLAERRAERCAIASWATRRSSARSMRRSGRCTATTRRRSSSTTASRSSAGSTSPRSRATASTANHHPPRAAVGWHDACARIEGPAVADVAEHFRMRWHEVTGETLARCVRPTAAGDVELQIVRTFPSASTTRRPRATSASSSPTCGRCKAAQRFIYLENQFLWSPEIEAVLADKLANPPHPDFRVVLVLPAKPNSGSDDTRGMLAESDRGRRRRRARPRVHALRPLRQAADPVYIHAKIAIIDDELAHARLGEPQRALALQRHRDERRRPRPGARPRHPAPALGRASRAPGRRDPGRAGRAVDELWKPISKEQLDDAPPGCRSPIGSCGSSTSQAAQAACSARSTASSSTAEPRRRKSLPRGMGCPARDSRLLVGTHKGGAAPLNLRHFGGVAAWSRAPPKTREQADPPRLREGR